MVEKCMDAKYLFESFKNNFNNEQLVQKLKWLRKKVIDEAIMHGDVGMHSEIYIDFEEAVREKQIDDDTFELIYYYLKFLSGRFLFHVGPNPDYEYVITITFFYTLNKTQLTMLIKTLEEVMETLWPEYCNYFKVTNEIAEPFRHTLRTTNLIVQTANERVSDSDFLQVTETIVSDLSTLSVSENKKGEYFTYTYKFYSFGIPVMTLYSNDTDLYNKTSIVAPKDYGTYKDCTTGDYDDVLWKMIARFRRLNDNEF